MKEFWLTVVIVVIYFASLNNLFLNSVMYFVSYVTINKKKLENVICLTVSILQISQIIWLVVSVWCPYDCDLLLLLLLLGYL